jgi:hypothetical protein
MGRVVAWLGAWLTMRRSLRVVVDLATAAAGVVLAAVADLRATIAVGGAMTAIGTLTAIAEAVLALVERMARTADRPQQEEAAPVAAVDDEWRWIPYGPREVHWRCAESRKAGSASWACTHCRGVMAEVEAP